MLTMGTHILRNGESKSDSHQCRTQRFLVTSVAMGLLTGFLGAGAGFLILPALVLLARWEMKPAIGTSLAVIAVNWFGGLIGQLHYVSLDWLLTLGFLQAAIVGMFAGSLLAKLLSAAVLRRGIAWCVVLLGFALVTGNLLLLFQTH